MLHDAVLTDDKIVSATSLFVVDILQYLVFVLGVCIDPQTTIDEELTKETLVLFVYDFNQCD